MPSINFAITAEDKNLLKVLKDIEKGVNGTVQTIEESGISIEVIFDKMKKAAASFGIALGAKEFIDKVVDIRGEFQQLEIAFNTMLGSEARATALMNQIIETSAKTPFGLQELANGAKQLMAYGVAAEEVNDSLVMLGDIASGLSIPLGDLVYLYGTTMTQGRMFTQDLRQFQGRGIPLADELAKQFGVTKDKVGELVTAGKVGFEDMHKALVALTSDGGKFAGLMNAQSQSISGRIETIKDSIEIMFNEIGKSSEGIINTALDTTSALVENYEKVGKVLGGVVATYGVYKAAIMTAVAIEKVQNIVLAETAVQMKLVAMAGHQLTTAQARGAAMATLYSAAQTKVLTVLKSIGTKIINPYTLAGVAITGVVAGVYKLATASRESEVAMGRVNGQIEKLKENQKELKEEVEGYVEILQSETASEYEKGKAYDALISKLPKLKDKYTEAQIAAKGLSVVMKEVNQENENKDILLTKQQIRETQNRIRVLKAEKEAFRISGNKAGYNSRVAEIRAEEQALAFLQKKEADYRAAKEKEQEKAKVKNKEYWENIKKDAELALDELGTDKEGTDEWNTLVKKIKQAQTELDKYNVSRVSKDNKDFNTQEAKQRERLEKIQEYKDAVIDAKTEAEFEIRQAEINALKEGTDKTLKQIDLDYDKQIEANRKRKEEFIDTIAEQKALEWEYNNPKLVEQGKKFDKSTVTEKDLTPEMRSILEFYDLIATKEKEIAQADATKELLGNYQTYMQKRMEILEKYAKDEAAMKNKDGSFKAGFSEDNVAILKQQRDETLSAVDTEFAMKEEQFENWANQVANMSLKTLDSLIAQAEAEIENIENGIAEGESAGKDNTDLMQARAAKAVLEEARKKLVVSPETQAERDWKDLYKTLNDVADQFDEIGELVGGTAGEIMSLAGGVASGVVSMIDGVKAVAKTGAASLSAIEKASVILAIIGTAIKIVTKIVNLARELHDKKHENEIQRLQEEVDELEKSYDKLGEKIDEAFSKDASNLIKQQDELLRRQRELIKLQMQEEEDKKKTDDSKLESYQQELDNIDKKLEENKQKAIDAIFGEDLQSAIEDFATAYADAVAKGSDKWTSVKDNVKNMMKQMVIESIKGALQSSKAIEDIRAKLLEFYSDNVLSLSEQEYIYKMAENVQKQIDQQFGWADNILKDSDVGTEQKATYGGFETMSEETGSELNGRFTALQMAGEEVKTQVIIAVTTLQSLVGASSERNSLLTDILTQTAIMNAYLEDLVKYSKVMSGYGAKLDKIVEQTKNL